MARVESGVTLEIAGRAWTAGEPLCACRGEAAGVLEYVPEGAELEAVVRRAAARREKCVFVCDVVSTAYRALVPFAAGFVFGSGTPLSHFAGHLRRHRVPACIDRALWQAARETALGDPGSPCRLSCGPVVEPAEDVWQEFAAGRERVRARWTRQPLVLPVLDLATGAPVTAARAGGAGIGEKALAVNALLAGGLPTPAGLVLVNPAANGVSPTDHPHVRAALDRLFPAFGRAGGGELIVRPSVLAGGGPHPPAGALKSRAVTSHAALTAAVGSLAAGRPRDGAWDLAVLVQERAAAGVRGILYTGRPWDYTAAGVVAALTFLDLDPADRSPHHVELDPAGGDWDTEARLTAQLTGVLPEGVPPAAFCPAFARFVGDALALRDEYGAPLDIEFVVTGAARFQFVQFRPLYRD